MRRVVVTGIGMVTPLGCGIKSNWNNLILGKSGATEITKFCLGILNDESVKSEIKNLYNPAINIIIPDPYIEEVSLLISS